MWNKSQSSITDSVMEVPYGISDLERLLDYELRCAKRYRRFVSIIVLAPTNGYGDVREMLAGDAIRECDQFFEIDDGAAILMSETDSTGALAAMERFQAASGPRCEFRSAVVSFPFDGHTAAELIAIARHRLGKVRSAPVGSIAVTTG